MTDVNGDPGNVGNFVAGTYGNLLIFSDGAYLYQANANVDPLQEGDNPTDTFNFTITDSLGRTQSTTLTINVTGHRRRARHHRGRQRSARSPKTPGRRSPSMAASRPAT